MNKTIVFVLFLILIVLGAGIFAAQQTGYLNVNNTLAPIAGAETLDSVDLVSPIETENNNLRKEKKDLEYQLNVLQGEKTRLLEQVTNLQTELTKLRADFLEQEIIALNVEELATYYQEMKPEAAVKIMDNLDDETIMLILPLLEKKQTAKIIALMDPLRAALITQLLLDKQVQ